MRRAKRCFFLVSYFVAFVFFVFVVPRRQPVAA